LPGLNSAHEAADGDSSEWKEDGKEFEGVAGFRGLHGEKEGATQEDVSQHGLPELGPEPKGGGGEYKIKRIERCVRPTEDSFRMMMRIDPPVEVDVEVLDTGAEGHIGDTPQRQP
jgi:hypothetical protein